MNVDIARELHDLAGQAGVDQPTRQTAESLAAFEKSRVLRADTYSPDAVHPVDHEWAALFADVTTEGERWAARSHVTICGMARNIGGILPVTFARLGSICRRFADYGVVIVENDSTDDTKPVLEKFARDNPGKVVIDSTDYGWEHLHGWEPERVQRYATLRNTYRRLANERFPGTDVVLCVDLDCWGGWSVPGLMNGCGWLQRKKAAACMASLSLYQHHFFAEGPGWGHYDSWALRVYGWKHELLPWKALWLPPAGCPPVQVYSAFGAAALYRPEAFYAHAYASIDGDIEHAGLHRSMVEDGWEIYLNPAQRSLMHWLTEEPNATGQHDSH